MPTPSSNLGLLSMEVIEGFDATIRPTSLPVLMDFDGVDPAVCRDPLHLHLEEQVLALDVERHELKTVVLGEQGPAGAPGRTGEVTIDVDTSLVQTGRMVYASSNGQVSHTDSRSLASALAVGAFAGVGGRVTALGPVENLLFSDVSPTPVVGQRVVLSAADDEPLDGAAGKVTTVGPSTGFVAVVGTVLSVDLDFGTTRRAAVMVRVLNVFKRNP